MDADNLVLNSHAVDYVELRAPSLFHKYGSELPVPLKCQETLENVKIRLHFHNPIKYTKPTTIHININVFTNTYVSQHQHGRIEYFRKCHSHLYGIY